MMVWIIVENSFQRQGVLLPCYIRYVQMSSTDVMVDSHKNLAFTGIGDNIIL